MPSLTRVSPYVALLVAWVATGGSLYFSLVLHWPPCDLCWYQRICMYPLAVILTVSLLKRDPAIDRYVLPLALPGALIAGYHYVLQKTDWLAAPACQAGVPCTGDYLNWFGLVTIPLLALTAFVLISMLVLAAGLNAADLPDSRPAAALAPGLPVVLIIGGVVLMYAIAAGLRGLSG